MGKSSRNDPIGTWRLVSVWYRGADGSMMFPYGDRPIGLLVYDASGNYVGQIAAGARKNFTAQGAGAVTTDEMAEAMRSYSAEFGRYEIDHNKIVHHVVGSAYPNWSNTDQTRMFSISGERLTLTAEPLPLGSFEVTIVLVWDRIA